MCRMIYSELALSCAVGFYSMFSCISLGFMLFY